MEARFQPFLMTKQLAANRRSCICSKYNWCGPVPGIHIVERSTKSESVVFSARISLHHPHDLNAWNRLTWCVWKFLCFSTTPIHKKQDNKAMNQGISSVGEQCCCSYTQKLHVLWKHWKKKKILFVQDNLKGKAAICSLKNKAVSSKRPSLNNFFLWSKLLLSLIKTGH